MSVGESNEKKTIGTFGRPWDRNISSTEELSGGETGCGISKSKRVEIRNYFWRKVGVVMMNVES